MRNFAKGLVAATIVLAVMFIGGNVQEPEAPVYAPVEETVITEEVVVTETEEVTEEKKVTKGVNKGSNEKIEVTKANTENLTEGKTEVEGNEKTTFVAPEAKNDDVKVIEEAKKDETKVVEDLSEGVTAVTEKVEDEKVQPQVEKETEKVEIPAEVEEVKSEEAKAEEVAPVVEEVPTATNDFDDEIDFSQFGF